MLWHQSLKSIHYRTLLIFRNKKNNRFEGQNMGGIKDMLSPHVKTWGDISPPSPPGFTPLLGGGGGRPTPPGFATVNQISWTMHVNCLF